MKAIPAPTPQPGGYPLKIVESNKADMPPVVVPLRKEMPAVVATGKDKISDAPENWDESWFANYE